MGGVPGGLVVKNLLANVGHTGDVVLIPDLGRRKWQPTLVFLLGKSHGQKNLVGYNLWGYRVGHD